MRARTQTLYQALAVLAILLAPAAVSAVEQTASFSRELLAQGMWSNGRKAELEGEFGLAAMNYFRAYHLYDALFQESADDAERSKWSEKRLQSYSDGLAVVRQYETIRGVRVDVRQLLEVTQPHLITGPKPLIRDKLSSISLGARSLPGLMTEPPESAGEEPTLGIFGERSYTKTLPFGGKGMSSLSVRGRKFIGWTANSTRYKKPTEVRKNSKDVRVDQQLQIQIGGGVAFQFQEALTVGVHFDDAEGDKNQAQAITIKFEPKEANGSPKKFQTPLGAMSPVAEFGDVNLLLEGTSYAFYNKGLFGITAALTFDDFHFFDVFRARQFRSRFVATQTKGISAHREFSGQNSLVVRDISDIIFLARTYYDLLGDLPEAVRATKLSIKVGSERLFRDDRNLATNTANTVKKTIFGQGADTFAGDFDPLVTGQDYFIDYQLGIVQFKTPVSGNAVLSVSFTAADGTVVTDSMIKNENVTDSYRVYELKNRYALGSNNIIRNDPDFIVQIRDLNNNPGFDKDSDAERTPDVPYNQIFGLDQNGDGRVDEKNVDFDFGILRFPDSTPFIAEDATLAALGLAGRADLSNPQIYTSNIPTQKYKIHVEYIQKTNVYLLNPSIVKNSEIITVDGTRMIRDQDYFLDYTSGFLQFLRPDLITSKSLIVVDYEYFPFTQRSNQTLIGTSLYMDVSPNINWAATFVSNFDEKPAEKPRVGEEPKKIDISDFSVSFNPLGMTKNWLGNWFTPPKLLDRFSLGIQFENATSRFNFNTRGVAILADFEDAGLIDQLGISQNQWRPEIPDGFGDTGIATFSIGQVSEVGHLDGLPNVSSQDLRNQSSLSVGYTFNAEDTYVAISFHISDVAQDFSKKTFLEFWVRDDNYPDVTLDVGILNEDADGDGLETEDKNADNLLNSGEDGGIVLAGIPVGSGNGILDSEDRDRDGTLDVDQAFFRTRLNTDSSIAEITFFPENKWRRYRVFLGTLLAAGGATEAAGLAVGSTQKPDAKVIKDIRLIFTKTGLAAGTTGTILVNDISIRGVSWEDDNFNDTQTFTVGVVSKRTDPNFDAPPVLAADVQALDAKALSISYASRTGQNVTKFLPLNDLRLSLYRNMSYWYRNGLAGQVPTNAGDTFIFRFGPDAANFFEIADTLTASTDWVERTVSLDQIELDLVKLNQDTKPPFNVTVNGVRVFGSPTLDRVRFMGAGVNSNGNSGQIFLDEIIIKDIEEEKGTANKSSFSSTLFDNLMTLNGSQEIVDNTFRPVGRINYGGVSDYVTEDRKSEAYNGSVKVSKLLFLDRLLKLEIPANFTKNKSKTFVNPDLVENLKRTEIGHRSAQGQTLGFSVTRGPKWPSFSANWGKQEEDVNQKTFVSRQENTDRSYSTSYGQSFNRKILWFIPIGRSFDYTTGFSRGTSFRDRDILLGTEKNSFQKSQSDNVSLSVHYIITRWFDWSFTLNQSLSRQTLSETAPLRESGRGRGYGWSWPLPTFIGLTPSLNWNFNFSESFNNESEFKSIQSSGNFGASIGIAPEKWWRRLKFFTISYAYSVGGSAAYQNLPERFGLAAVFDDFYKNIFLFWKGGKLEVTSDTLALLRNSASTSRSHSFGGSIKIWESLSTTYSSGFSASEVQSLNSVEVSDAFSFNLNNTWDLKRASRLFKGPNSAALTYGYAFSSSVTRTTQSRNITNNVSWPVSWTDRFRTSLSYAFNFSDAKDRLSFSKNAGQNSAYSMSYLISNPFKMTSFTGNLLRFQNRLELTSGMNWAANERELDGAKKDDNMSYGSTLGLNYDIRENFRVNGTFGYNVTSNEITPDDDRSVTSFAATAELRF